MLKNARNLRKIIVSILCLTMILGSLNIGVAPMKEMYTNVGNLAYAAEVDTSAPDNIQDGTMLQAFCWSFNTIKDNMADIAAAGFTAVQTSPIQESLDTSPGMTLNGSTGMWYYHYQPTDFTIGNYQLGTEVEFEAMCVEADKYGIKIMVDLVPNHTAVNTAQVSENLLNAVGGMDNLYHETGLTSSQNYSDRLETTTYAIGSLPDINTENKDFQDYFIGFLNKAIAYGVDGFRYDSAKHIGLPDDPRAEGAVNNFWERVTTDITNAENIFNYGEILQGSNDRHAAYIDAIGATTASVYGADIRTALVNNNFTVSNISSYKVDEGVNPDNLVTWVESHDNFYNDKTFEKLDNSDIILGWAVITARANGTPLFFSRPDGSSPEVPYGTNTIGIAGDDTFKDDQVAAVNKFRNAMVGETENLTNPDGNAKVLMIERGTKGVVIVNASSGNYAVDAQTSLENGTYINRTDDNSVFTVVNGEISGVLPSKSVVVLYEAEPTNSTTVHFYNSDNWGTVYAYEDATKVLGAYPGTKATSDGDGWWRVTVSADVADGFVISFNDGADNKTNDLTVDDGTTLYYTKTEAFATKVDAEAALGVVKTAVHFFNSGSWDEVNAYAYVENEKLFGAWPGTAAKSNGDGWWTVEIPSAPADNLTIIFNGSVGGVNSETPGFVISDSTNVYVTNEKNIKYTSETEALTDIDMLPGTTTVYFYNNSGWATVNAYAWGNGVSLGGWPGTAAINDGDNWWKITLPANPSMDMTVIFNGGGAQTKNFVISDITNRYTSNYSNKKYSSKEALLDENFVAEVELHFYKPENWSSVYAYASKDGDLLGEYPGTAATLVGDNWYKIMIPVGPDSNLQVSFNDGSEDKKSDTFTVNNNVNVYYSLEADTGYASKIATEVALGLKEATTTIHFYNSANWASVSAYTYGPEVTGGWPGKAAIDEGDGWWKITVPTYPTYTIIFNNSGGGKQSADFKITDYTNNYVTNFGSDKFDSKEAAARTLIGVVTPTATTGLVNGTVKTADALGLPEMVTLVVTGGTVNAVVTWDVDSATYDPTITEEQKFTVSGNITLPTIVKNPENLSLTTTIDVTVDSILTLISVTTPDATTGLVNGTVKTADALGLPEMVTLVVTGGTVNAVVTWDVDSATYDPTITEEQKFTVSGNITLPAYVENPDNVSLTTTIEVTVAKLVLTLTIGDEVDGGVSKKREVTLNGSNIPNLAGKYLVVQVTKGTGANAMVSVTMVPAATSITVSYETAGSVIDVWLADGMPNFTTPDNLGASIMVHATTNN